MAPVPPATTADDPPPFERVEALDGQLVIQRRQDERTFAARARRLPLLGRLVDREPVARVAAARRVARHLTPAAAFAGRHLANARTTAVYGIRGSPLRIVVRHGTTDVWTVVEILELGLYDPPPPVVERLARATRPLRVLDLGANIGLFGAVVRTREPTATIVAFEPDPANAAVLRRCIALNGEGPPWELVQACAASSDGTIEFAAAGHSGSHAVEAGSHERGIVVAKRDVFPWLEEADLAKVDIEGGEWELLVDGRLRAGPDVLVLEYHPSMCDHPDPHARAATLLDDAGYELRSIYQGSDGHGMLWAWRTR